LNANPVWADVWAMALGGATPPVPASIVILVAVVHLEKSLLEKSSAKIDEVTVIGSEVGPTVGPLLNLSIASTV